MKLLSEGGGGDSSESVNKESSKEVGSSVGVTSTAGVAPWLPYSRTEISLGCLHTWKVDREYD